MCKNSINKKPFQSKANCSLTNRRMGYICVGGRGGGELPEVNKFEQAHVVGEGDGARRVPMW